jgi:hypothetical protein
VLDAVDRAHPAGANAIEHTVAPVDYAPQPCVGFFAAVVDRDPALPTEPNLRLAGNYGERRSTVTANGHGTETNLAEVPKLNAEAKVGIAPGFNFPLALKIEAGILRPLIASHLGRGWGFGAVDGGLKWPRLKVWCWAARMG